ncbi:MAG TPA: type III pantothenate kinase [Actinobacteria bacterium]|nr:type III pantothenate kinase [Actinomycetota bacterium]
MLLAIDVGNTQTVLGLYEGDRLVGHWRIASETRRTSDELRWAILGILERDGFGPDDVSGFVVSSVVPSLTAVYREVAAAVTDGEVVVVEPGIRTGLAIHIDHPREVGADRIANAVAARARHGAPVVTVDFGTSTNFDVVGPEGDYLGGVIAAGLEIATTALVAGTAALRRVEYLPPRSVIGKSTVEAIQSGALYGHAGLVDGIVDRIRDELGVRARVVATGGLASTIVPHCRSVDVVDEFLTLEGLRLLYELNREVA